MKKIMVGLLDLAQRATAGVLIVLSLPLSILLSLVIVVCSGWPLFFVQKRVGKNGRIFNMYKFRTMVVGAEDLRESYQKLNEASGPVFKIKNDPRFVGIGKFLCHSGLDELPQLINIFWGEMNFIGPRPLPVYEADKIAKKYIMVRQSVKPGIVSTWVLDGHHKMSFESWMEEDIKYIQNRSLFSDLILLSRSIGLFGNIFIQAMMGK